VLDPGSGFGKSGAQTVRGVRRIDEICAMSGPGDVAFLAQSTLGKLMGDPMRRCVGGAVFCRGARWQLVRKWWRGPTACTRDLRERADALRVAAAVLGDEAQLVGLPTQDVRAPPCGLRRLRLYWVAALGQCEAHA